MSPPNDDTVKDMSKAAPAAYYGGIDPMILNGLSGTVQNDDIQIRKHFTLLYRFRLVIFFCGFIGLALGAYTNYKVVPTYSTTATVSVGSYVPPLEGPIANVLRNDTKGKYYLKNQISLLKSNAIARNVLSNNPQVRKYFGLSNDSATNSSNDQGSAVESETPDDIGTEIPVNKVQSYLGTISYRSIYETSLVNITARASTPESATIIANGHSQGFINLVRQQRLRAAQVNMKYLRKRAIVGRDNLTNAQEALREYAIKHGIVDASVGSQRSQYNAIQSTLGKANLDLATSEARASEVRRGSASTIASLKGEHIKLAKLEGELRESRKFLAANNPFIRQLKAEIEVIKRIIKTTSEQEVRRVELENKINRSKERFLTKHLKEVKQDELEKAKSHAQYNILKEAYETARESYKSISRRLDDAIVNAENDQKTVVLVDPALPPTAPNNLRDSTTLWHGLAFGMVIGIGIAYFFNLLDNKIRTVEDVQDVLQVPILGVVPIFRNQKVGGKKKSYLTNNNKTMEHEPTALLSSGENSIIEPSEKQSEETKVLIREENSETEDPHPSSAKSDTGSHDVSSETAIIDTNLVMLSAPMSSESEAFRTVLTTMNYMNLEGSQSNTTLITSSQQGDGKTTIACNLSMALAEMSGSTLLIDADLRLPAVGRSFNQPRRVPGLSDYLLGDVNYYDVLHQNFHGELSILFAGNVVPNPASLLQSKKMTELMDILRDEYDHIIIDGPPLSFVADGLLLSRLVDGVAVVIRSGKTSKPMAKAAVSQLKQIRANVIGSILNGVEHSRNNKYDNYYYYTEEAESS